jgi:hypothetical protein
LHYLANLAARKQRRTLSSFIEWAVQNSLSAVMISEGGYQQQPQSIAEVANELWDTDSPDRFIKLAVRFPDMLNHSEQVLWKLIRENGYLWRGGFNPITKEWGWKVREEGVILDRLRQWWPVFKTVAQGEADKDTLPSWTKTMPEEKDEDVAPMDEEDIPF